MTTTFSGTWRGTVIGKSAGFSQRIEVAGGDSGSGVYDGVVGTTFVVSGDLWTVRLQWNDNAGSGWQDSDVIVFEGMTSPLVTIRRLGADDNQKLLRDGDYDDLTVAFEHLDAPFKVVQRPFALDRGTLTMLPDGIFDVSQGIQYMGVRIRNTWLWPWQSSPIPTGMIIGISPTCRANLAGIGIEVLDDWTPQEQEAFDQQMDGGFVRVPDLAVGQERMIYFKIDVSNAGPGKPSIAFVAQRDAFDARYDEPTRWEEQPIFISRSSYDASTRELVAEVPEGKVRLRLGKIILDRKAANKAAQAARDCFRKYPESRSPSRSGNPKRQTSERLRRLLRDLLAGKPVDPCVIQRLLELSCEKPARCSPCGSKDLRHPAFPGGGLGDGAGGDDWCRIKPVAWLPVEFEYSFEPNPAFTGQHGPLAFNDPWWKVILIILAVLLAIASVVADYVTAAEDPRFQIGKVVKKGDVMTNGVDCALSDLNGSRGINLGVLDAQGDDVNNGDPIIGLDQIVQLDRTDNGDLGIQDAVVGNVVFKSGGTSATTRGVVELIDYATEINYDESEFISGDVAFANQVLVIQVAATPQPLSQGGDSGSVWIDLISRRPVALNFAGPVDDSGATGTGNPIRAVCDNLNIRFNI